MTPKPKKEKWEERFEKEFDKCLEIHLDVERKKRAISEAMLAEESFKSFSSQQIKQAQKEEREKIIRATLNYYSEIMEKWRKYRGFKTCGEFFREKLLEKLKKEIK